MVPTINETFPEENNLTRFKTRPEYVEAFQWQNNISDETIPFWLSAALDRSHNDLHGKVRRVGNNLSVLTNEGWKFPQLEDWIVYYQQTSKTLDVVNSCDFEKRFEIDERRPPIRSIRLGGRDKSLQKSPSK